MFIDAIFGGGNDIKKLIGNIIKFIDSNIINNYILYKKKEGATFIRGKNGKNE